jgi:hypothetical protein
VLLLISCRLAERTPIGESEREAMKVFDREIAENSHTESHTEKVKDLTEAAKSLN